MTKIFNKIGTGLLGILLLASCQDRDLPGSAEMQLITPDASSITGTLTGDNNYDYTRLPLAKTGIFLGLPKCS